MEWKVSTDLVFYEDAVGFMEDRVAKIHAGKASDLIWLLEHPSLYTGGTSARPEDLLKTDIPAYDTGRGGQYTYHGPGQRIAYVMMNLRNKQKAPDLKSYICSLEEWVIQTLKEFGIDGERREGRVGIWVNMDDGSEKKVAAIGVRVRKWVTYHGIAINVNPDLSYFDGIVPCGIKEHGVTSLEELGVSAAMQEVDEVLRRKVECLTV